MRRRTLGPEHPESLVLARELGGLYRAQGKYDQAESLLTETLEAHRRAKPGSKAEMLLAMDALATAYVYHAKYAQAEPLLLEALRKAKQSLGMNNSTTHRIMLGLAGLYFRQRKAAGPNRC